MSTNSPQEVTQKSLKYQSLPDELKSIADELIRDKFGVEEEVVPDVGQSFRNNEGKPRATYVGPDEFFIDPTMGNGYIRSERQRGYRDEIRVEIRPWDSSRVATLQIGEPSFDCLRKGMQRFDMENIRNERTFIMHPNFYRSLMCDPNFGHYVQERYNHPVEGARNVIAQIFGVDIEINPRYECILEARF